MYTITTRFCSVLLIQGNIPIEQHKQSLSWGCAAAIIPSTSLGAIQGVSGYAASIVPLTDNRGKSVEALYQAKTEAVVCLQKLVEAVCLERIKK